MDWSIFRFAALGLIAATAPVSLCHGSEDSNLQPLAAAQIKELRLRESDTPVRDLPGYKPLQRVLVTVANHPGLADALAAVAPGVEFVLIPGVRASSHAPGPYDAVAVFSSAAGAALEHTGPVAWVHSYSAGIEDLVDHAMVKSHRPLLTNSRGTAAAAIAEHAIGMMMAQARQLHRYRDNQATSTWGSEALVITAEPWPVAGKTVLILGLGAIGTEIAKRAHGLGMRVTATRNSSREGPDYVSYVGLSHETLTLAAKADVVINALPLTSSTTGLINREFLQAMKPSAIVLSIGRGPTIVTDDLLWAIRNNEIAGAGLDVTDPEPLPADHPLWKEPKVIITPHIAYAGSDPLVRFGLLLENLRRYQAGDALLNVADIDKGY